MENHKTSRKFSPEVRERAVRMVLEHSAKHASQWAAITSIAAKIGCTAQTLHTWMRQAERAQGLRSGPTHGVEPICRVLAIAPSTYHAHARRRANPEMAAEAEAAYCASMEVLSIAA